MAIEVLNPNLTRSVADYASSRNGESVVNGEDKREISILHHLPEIDYGLGHSPFGAPDEIFKILFSAESETQGQIRHLIEHYPQDLWSDNLANQTRERFSLSEDVHVSWQPGGSYRILANILSTLIDWTPEKETGIISPGLAFPNIALLANQFARHNGGQLPFTALPLPLDLSYEDRLIALTEHRKSGVNSQVIFVDLPNNPTGDSASLETVINLAEATSQKPNQDLLIIDEAYGDSTGFTTAQLTEEFPNLIVLKGVSKGIGLSGIRAGYAIVSKGELSKLYKQKMDLVFDMGALSQLLIETSLQPEILEPHLEKVRQNTIQVKSHILEQLNSLGIEVFNTRLDVPIMLVRAPQLINFAPFLARHKIVVEQGQDFTAVHQDMDNSMARIRIPASTEIADQAIKRIKNAIDEAQQNPSACWI